MNKLVTINLVVLNGEKYIGHALTSIRSQTYPNIEVNIYDNGSTDKTKDIIKSAFPEFNLLESQKNYSMWGGQDKALAYSHGEYIVAMSVDIILDKDFIKNSVDILNHDTTIGALEPKIYSYKIENGQPILSNIIDTCGFQIYKSRLLVNIGHGEKDRGQFNDRLKEIFAVEGAVPILRRSAVEDIRIGGEFNDVDFWWYADDIDFAWRMRLLGWKEVYSANVIAYHDRSTTKNLVKPKSYWWQHLKRVGYRQQIPIQKRRLDWRNLRFTIVKNDYIINILRDAPKFFWRELKVLGYIILFEPQVLLEIPTLLRLLPKMLHKRKLIMQRAKVGPREIHKWFI